MKKVCVLGGDMRQHYLAEEFKNRGFTVAALGVPKLENTHTQLASALEGAEILALPCPLRKDENIQIFTDEFVDMASITRHAEKNCSIFVGGNFSFPSFNYLKDETFLQKNAEITAEGAIALMMQNSLRTLDGAKILTVGFGRIGKALAERLHGLGSDVFVSARSERDISQIIACGYHPVITRQYRNLEQFDFVCNTVPAAVFSSEQVRQLHGVYIELASAPGGLAADAGAPERYLLARGLPGKYAPQSAALAMADCILQNSGL